MSLFSSVDQVQLVRQAAAQLELVREELVFDHPHLDALGTNNYVQHQYEREKREALELWADRLQGIVSGAADVVPMERKR